ncbi:hypothetical protein ACFO3H_20895, partial [Halorussus sp. GCM10023401]
MRGGNVGRRKRGRPTDQEPRARPDERAREDHVVDGDEDGDGDGDPGDPRRGEHRHERQRKQHAEGVQRGRRSPDGVRELGHPVAGPLRDGRRRPVEGPTALAGRCVGGRLHEQRGPPERRIPLGPRLAERRESRLGGSVRAPDVFAEARRQRSGPRAGGERRRPLARRFDSHPEDCPPDEGGGRPKRARSARGGDRERSSPSKQGDAEAGREAARGDHRSERCGRKRRQRESEESGQDPARVPRPNHGFGVEVRIEECERPVEVGESAPGVGGSADSG